MPTNKFGGVGGELGYRYYFGRLGPHGLYVGPSFLLGIYHADVAGTTSAVSGVDYRNYGAALDVGYQAILGSVLIGLSAGAQYVYVDHTFADQNDLFANVQVLSAVHPRASFTFGYAF